MTPGLNAGVLARIPAAVRRPDYDFLNSSIGIVHLGLGAFHRAHQALYTEDALRSSGGGWGGFRPAFRPAGRPAPAAPQQPTYTPHTPPSPLPPPTPAPYPS